MIGDYLHRILIVDDKEDFLENSSSAIRQLGYSVTACPSYEQARSEIIKSTENPFDLAILDIALPDVRDREGLVLARLIRERVGEVTSILIMTANLDTEVYEAAWSARIDGFLPKSPRLMEDGQWWKERLADVERKRRQADYARVAERAEANALDSIIGTSPAIQALKDRIRRLAKHDTTVLITGESGVGKELVARAVHQTSPRSNRPFLAVNTAAVSEEVLNSELFGHVKGAFTGAIDNHMGAVEVAGGGAIFLDEIGHMPLGSQASLLRLIQEGEFQRVGAMGTTIRADVRFIAATNCDLGAAIQEGRFREDLFFRLNVYAIPVPPLRDRREDIPLLLDHFSQRWTSSGKPLTWEKAALKVVLEDELRGNVRQLGNLVEVLAIECEEEHVKPSDVVDAMARWAMAAGRRVEQPSDNQRDLARRLASLDTLEAIDSTRDLAVMELYRRVLNRHGGNESAAARILREKPSTLRSRTIKFDKEHPGWREAPSL